MKKLSSLVLMGLLAAPALSQDKAEGPKPRPPVTALRVQLVLSRFQGERKIASRPYSLSFGTHKQLTLRQGTEVPIPVTKIEKDGKDVVSFQYKNVGANMEFTAEPTDGGRFLLSYAIEDSALWDEQTSVAKPGTPEAPAFNIVNLRGMLALRDGETAISTTTHAVTGEVTKFEITLNVVK